MRPPRRPDDERDPLDVTRCRVSISGRVQGVWFRETCRERATTERVAGWVRNRPDGSVEAVFEGSRAAVERMVSWCHDGPPRAHVAGVEITSESPVGEVGFRAR